MFLPTPLQKRLSGEDEEGEDESEEEDSDEDDYDFDDDDEEEVDDSCPPGCDIGLYEKVFIPCLRKGDDKSIPAIVLLNRHLVTFSMRLTGLD